jgi:hypothetical protein
VGNYPPDAQNKLDRIYNAYRQSAVNQSYYASQYANRPGANFVASSLTDMFQQINASVINGNLRPDVDQSRSDLIWDCVQTGLDLVGMVPVVGEVADGINVGIHVYRGNYTEAAMSAAAMVPWVGAGVTAAKFTRKLGKIGNVVPVNPNQAANLAKVRDGIEGVNKIGGDLIRPFEPNGLIKIGFASKTMVPGEAFHYTSSMWANAIKRDGLRPRTYATPSGNLGSLQAKLELALPPTRTAPDIKIRIDLDGLKKAGFEIPLTKRVSSTVTDPKTGRVYQMPGGGTEMQFPFSIPSEFLEVLPLK